MTKPARCHFDRPTRERMTNRHADTCPGPTSCDGCIPCEHDHCVLCRRRHTDDQHPLVCDDCVRGIREDLDAIAEHARHLREEAVEGGQDGHLVAAAPIPGGDAMVLIGPSGDREVAMNRYESAVRGRLEKSVLWSKYADDHRPKDPVPPLAVLVWWEDTWRAYLQTKSREQWVTYSEQGRASMKASLAYFKDHLTLMAQIVDGPDIQEFAAAIAAVRSGLQALLHDETQPERGVECFECGQQLVRRIRERRACHHSTPARVQLRGFLERREAARDRVAELGPRLEDLPRRGREALLETAKRLPSPAMLQAARAGCVKCSQGGVDDPSPGLSWECPGCRKKYDPGEYATAVRRDLLDSNDGDGWTHISLAAEAAGTLTGRVVEANTVRRWMDRGLVASCCVWTRGQAWGTRLVYWPDVADRATRPTATSRRAS